MPSFRQARQAGSSLEDGEMSTFPFGRMQVRRSGLVANHLPKDTMSFAMRFKLRRANQSLADVQLRQVLAVEVQRGRRVTD